MLPRTETKPVATTSRRKMRARRSIRSFFKKEDGTATVEAVLWIPFFFALFTLVVDGSIIFNNHSNMLRIVHDTNRAYSVGQIESGAQAEATIKAKAAHISNNIKVKTFVDNGVINTFVEVPVEDMDMTGLFTGIASARLTINSQHYLEL